MIEVAFQGLDAGGRGSKANPLVPACLRPTECRPPTRHETSRKERGTRMMTLPLGLLALVPLQDPQGTIWDRLQFYANGRMRGEATFDNVDANTGNDIDDRYRGRFRFRFGAKYELTEDMMLEGRLSTSSDGNDANNPHWDFGDGDGFNGSGIVMDRFFLDWDAKNDIHVLVGKQPHA